MEGGAGGVAGISKVSTSQNLLTLTPRPPYPVFPATPKDNLLLETLIPIGIFVASTIGVVLHRIRMRNAAQGANLHALCVGHHHPHPLQPYVTGHTLTRHRPNADHMLTTLLGIRTRSPRSFWCFRPSPVALARACSDASSMSSNPNPSL